MKLLKQNFPTSPTFTRSFSALFVWMLAGAGVVFWFLQFPVQDGMLPASETLTLSHRTQAPSDAGLGRALGVVTTTAAAPTPLATRFQLMGVIAASSGQGSALIGSDGQPPKAYREGQVVADGLTLADLSPRQVKLKSAGTELLLELAAPPEKP